VLASAALGRSVPHRFTIATSLSLALAVAAICVRAGLKGGVAASSVPLSLLQIQTYMIALLLIGARYAVTLPAAQDAGWVFDVVWTGNARGYRAGVRRPIVAGLLLPAVAVLFPFHVWALGWRFAMAHAFVGVAISAIGAWAAIQGIGGLPLVAPHEPSETLTTRFPVYVLGIVSAILAFAWLERLVLGALGIPAA
jgi:hypothetical protein